MSSSEERKDQLGTDLVDINYRLNERLGEMEEWEKLDPVALGRWEAEYRKVEKRLLASLGSTETVAYLLGKAQLLESHTRNIS